MSAHNIDKPVHIIKQYTHGTPSLLKVFQRVACRDAMKGGTDIIKLNPVKPSCPPASMALRMAFSNVMLSTETGRISAQIEHGPPKQC